jgi:hypothetical protein
LLLFVRHKPEVLEQLFLSSQVASFKGRVVLGVLVETARLKKKGELLAR